MANQFIVRRQLKLSSLAAVMVGLLVVVAASRPTETKAAFAGYNGKITYYSNRDGTNEIFVANSDGSNPVRVTSLGNFAREARWSPDGSKLAFRSNHESAGGDIYVMNADGSSLTRLTNSSGFDTGPSWNPAGDKIVFQSARDGGEYEVYIMNADGSNQTRLTNHAAYDGLASFTPDGNRILFRSNRDGDGDVYRMDVDGGNITRLTTAPGLDSVPHMSPDGTKIVFQSTRDGNNEVYIMNADGSNQIRLTNSPGFDQWATFSADGKYILFHSDRDSGDYHVYRMNVDGSNQTRLTELGSATLNAQPDWQTIRNVAPTVVADAASTLSNAAVLVDVLVNDSDEEALNPANLTIQTQPNHGTAIIESGKVKYTSSAGFVGSDQLTYKICDSFVLDQKCANGVVTLNVQPQAKIMQVGNKVVENGVAKVVAPTNRPTFSGTATPNSVVKVEIHSDPIILTTTADAQGNWSITPDQDLPPGNHTVYISATLNGATTELGSFVLAVQQTTPNTGFNSLIIRMAGSGLLLVGASLAYMYRRRMRDYFEDMPKLFP